MEKFECFLEQFLKKERITGMIFDVDGVLLDSMPFWSHCGERYLASLGIYAPPSLGRTLFALTMRDGAEYIKKTYGIRQDIEEIMAGINRNMAAAYQTEIQRKPKAGLFLDALRAAGIPMAVATSTDKSHILAAFGRLGLTEYFAHIFTCSAFGSGKDKPEIFHAAAKSIHSDRACTWVVEDGLYAARTARRAGYPVIGVSDDVSRADAPAMREIVNYFITLD